MTIRKIREDDARAFFEMLCALDGETDRMMYEPGERRRVTKSLDPLKARIASAVSGGDLLLVAEDEEKGIAGFLWAERGTLERVRHTAYIVTGILRAYRGKGTGTRFFEMLGEWARENGVTRLELTVECANEGAIRLYVRHGFHVEGTRRGSMLVNGELTDEYYMAAFPFEGR